MLINYLKNRRKSKIRMAMRGYYILSQSSKLPLINEIREKLAETQVSIFSNSILIKKGLIAKSILEQNFQQYLVLNILTVSFNEKLLAVFSNKNKKISHPLPYEWRIELEKFGFVVNTFSNKINYKIFSLKFFLKGIYELLYLIIQSVFYSKSKIHDLSGSVYFHNLKDKNIPKKISKDNHDIISWYMSRFGNSESDEGKINIYVNYDKIDVNLKSYIKYIESPVLIKIKYKKLLLFIYHSIKSLINSFFSLFSRDIHGLILSFQIIRFLRIHYSNYNSFPKKVLFNNSDYIYRPLWTFAFDKNITEVILYFYSTNCETFKSPSGYVKQQNFWHLCNWDIYYVWDDYQYDFIIRNISYPSKIQIVGIVDFQNSSIPFKIINTNSIKIAVFDVQPTRSSWYQTLGIDIEYYVPNVVNSFNNDIFETLSKFNIDIFFKGKRHIGSLADKFYQKNLSKWSKSNKINILDPDISARQIIENCDIVISMPFSTPSVIAKLLNKTTYYYDPTGIIQIDDRASHGVQIIRNKEQLFNIIQSKLSICEE